MKIERNKYLKRLVDKQFNGLVKVITGIRRSGKSYLLFNIYKDYLLSTGVSDNQIIALSLDEAQNAQYRNPLELDQYIRSKLSPEVKYFLFIDEIQFVQKIPNPYLPNDFVTFYDVLNGLLKLNNVDIYVTGSNSRMLSRDILTEFRGRSDEIHVLPLTFAEFMSVYNGDKYDGLLDYCAFGGLPAVALMSKDEDKSKYLINLFKETYVRDIVERNKVKNDSELEELLNVLASSIGSLTNPSKLANTFKSVKNVDLIGGASKPTIKKYLDYLEDAFIIHSAMRYDVKGKKYISTPVKYYFEDVGLRNARLNFRQLEYNHIMENVVYNELRFRGYNVDVGVVEISEKQPNNVYSRKQLEIDFVANLGSSKHYIQFAYKMPVDEKVAQEQRPLLSVDDFFKKTLIVGERTRQTSTDKGIAVIDIYDFLLNE